MRHRGAARGDAGADERVHVLSLLRRGCFSCTDGPYRLVGNDSVLKRFVTVLIEHGIELTSHDLFGDSLLAFRLQTVS